MTAALLAEAPIYYDLVTELGLDPVLAAGAEALPLPTLDLDEAP